MRCDLSNGAHTLGWVIAHVGKLFRNIDQRLQKRSMGGNNAQVSTVNRREEADCIGHARVVGEEKYRADGGDMLTTVDMMIVYVMALQKSAGCFIEPHLTHQVIIFRYLLSKRTRRLDKKSAEHGREHRSLLPS